MSKSPLTLFELDAFVDAAGLPVRPETLAGAWNQSSGEASALPAGQVLLLVTMRVRPGMAPRFEAAAGQFVQATRALAGALTSTLRRAEGDVSIWFLIERFVDRAAFDRHMASGYFRDFQIEQQSLLAEPVEAIFLEGSRAP